MSPPISFSPTSLGGMSIIDAFQKLSYAIFMEKNTRISAHGGEYEINKYGRDKISLDFSVNLNPLGIPESIKTVLDASSDYASRYPSLDHNELVELLAAKRGISKDWILMGNGASEIISLIVSAVTVNSDAKGSTALIIEPTFSGYERALKAHGVEITHLTLSEDIVGYIKKNPVSILFACSPNNPTGRVIEPQLLKELADTCKEQGTILVIDECFMGFVESQDSADKSKYSTASLIPDNDHIVLIDAFTKLYAVPGIRLGYCISSNRKLLDKMAPLAPEWNISAIAEAAGIAVLSEDDYLREARELIANEKAFLTKELTNLGFTVFPGEAPFILVKLPDNTNSFSFYESMIKDQGILLRNCSNFHGLDESFYRIAIKKHDENVKLVQACDAVLRR